MTFIIAPHIVEHLNDHQQRINHHHFEQAHYGRGNSVSLSLIVVKQLQALYIVGRFFARKICFRQQKIFDLLRFNCAPP